MQIANTKNTAMWTGHPRDTYTPDTYTPTRCVSEEIK